MERCETCRFWKPSADWIGHSSWDLRDGWQVCARATRAWDEKTHGPTELGRAMVSAADDYDLALWTAPDFGCVEHQPIG